MEFRQSQGYPGLYLQGHLNAQAQARDSVNRGARDRVGGEGGNGMYEVYNEACNEVYNGVYNGVYGEVSMGASPDAFLDYDDGSIEVVEVKNHGGS